VQRFRSGAPVLDLSLCASSLTPDLSPHDVYRAFSGAKLSSQTFSEKGAELLAEPELAVRLGDRVFRCARAPYRHVARVTLRCVYTPQLGPGALESTCAAKRRARGCTVPEVQLRCQATMYI
jgi:hypothetical protein